MNEPQKRDRMMHSLLLIIIATLTLSVFGFDKRAGPFPVRIQETWFTLKPTAGPNNLANCAVIRSDGRFHLVIRRQEFFDGENRSTAFDGQIPQSAMINLEHILDDASIKKLATFSPPQELLSGDDSSALVVEISRDNGVQKVGYFSWNGAAPSDAESSKEQWREAKSVLSPLTQWFRAMKSYKNSTWRRVANTSCDLQ